LDIGTSFVVNLTNLCTLNLWELSHMKEEKALFFKRLEINLMEALMKVRSLFLA
jgi:hypothetical protein